MQSIQFISTSPQELQNQINEGVRIQLQEFLKHFEPIQPKEYLTKRNVADMFQVDISTINNWSKSKRLNPLGIGSRIFFLRSEVEASIKSINV